MGAPLNQTIDIVRVDYGNPVHAEHLIELMNRYSCDPMGGGVPLAGSVKSRLVAELAKLPNALSLLAYRGDAAIGLANCFLGFSTFRARALLNLHDLVVLSEYRGCGVGQALLGAVENLARQHLCCKVTLEVLSNNHRAKRSYTEAGFQAYSLKEETGTAEFWEKYLD